jgi:hypothetical protein
MAAGRRALPRLSPLLHDVSERSLAFMDECHYVCERSLILALGGKRAVAA